MGFSDGLMFTRDVVEQGPERIVLDWNRRRPAVLGGGFLVLGAPLFAVGVSVLLQRGPGEASAWMALGVAFPPLLVAGLQLRKAWRRDRIVLDRTAGEVRLEGPDAARFSFSRVAGVETRRHGSDLQLLLEVHGRAPMLLLQGRSLEVRRLADAVRMLLASRPSA